MIGTLTTAKAALAGSACLATLEVSEITGLEKLGVVGLLLIALAVIYRDGNRRQNKLETIIENNTKALTENSDTRREHVTVMQKIASVMEHCHKQVPK